MAVTTIRITGTVLLPNAQPAPGGSIQVELAQRTGTVDDSGTEQVVAPRFTVVIEADGTVDFNIIPTDLITVAAGSAVYKARYELINGDSWETRWAPTSGADLDIGDIPIVVSATAERRYIVITDEANLPPESAVYRESVVYLKGGAGVADMAWRCMKDENDAYSWVVMEVG